MSRLSQRNVLPKLFSKTPPADQVTPRLLDIFSALGEIPLRYTDKPKALKRITELCQEAMGSHACTLALVDLSRDILTYGASSGPNAEFEDFMNSAQISIGQGYSMDRDLIAAGKVVERYNLPRDGGGIARPEIARKHHLQSGLCHPLKSDGHLLGYLAHFSSKSTQFTDEEKRLLKIFAEQSVNVIERFDQYRAHDHLAQILSNLSTQLLSLPLHEFLHQVAMEACQLLAVPVGIVWMLDTSTDTFRIYAATANVDEKYRTIHISRDQFVQWEHLYKGKVEHLTNVQKQHKFYFHSNEAEERGWVSLLSAPLRVDGELIGMLDIYTEKVPRRFKLWEKEAFSAFANSAAIAIQKARLQERQIVAEIWETIEGLGNDTHKGVTLSTQLDTTLNRIVEQGAKATHAETCYLRLLNRANEQLELQAYYDSDNNRPRQGPPYGQPLAVGQGVAGYVAQTGQSYIASRVDIDPLYANEHVGQRPQSLLSVPIKSGQMVIGTLSIGSATKASFGLSEQQLLESISARISITIERAHLMDNLQRLSEIATHAKSHEDILSQIVTLTRELMREPICLVWWLNKDRNGFTLQSSAVPPAQKEHLRGLFIPNDSENFQLFLRKKHPICVPDVTTEPLHPYKDIVGPLGWKSGLGMALTIQGNPLGFLEIYSYGERRDFTNWHLQLFKTFAEQASLALENVSRRTQLERLNETIGRMADFRKAEDVLVELLKGCLALSSCTVGSVSQLDYKTGERETLTHFGPPPNELRLQLGEGITGKALQEGQPQRAGNVHDKKWENWYRRQSDNTNSELAIPIIVSNAAVRIGRQVQIDGTQPIGVLNLESPTLDAFSQEEEDLLWSLARQGAVIINRIEFDGRLTNLTAFQKEIFSVQKWDAVLDLATQRIMDALDFGYIKIGFLDREQTRLTIERQLPHPSQHSRTNAVFLIKDSPALTEVITSGEILVSHTDDQEKLLQVFVPMTSTSDTRILGIVEAGYAKGYRRHIYERDVQILRGFVDYTVRALENEEQGILERVFHELVAPIVGIRNNASFLQRRWRTLPEDSIKKKFSDIQRDCDILLHQAKQLQHAFGHKPAASKRERTLVMLDIVVKTINQLKPLARERRFEPGFMRYRDEDLAKIDIYVDREKLNQIVYNLLINAIKYAKDSPAEFSVMLIVEEAAENFVVKFKDWGIGVRAGDEERIFERGVRTPDAIRKDVSGSGLGLTIARELAREIGGDLRLAHNMEPTEFVLVLPKK